MTTDETPKLKACKDCQVEKPETEFFIAVKGKYERRHPRCKRCHRNFNRGYYKPRCKPRGFAALPPEVQSDILKMVEENTKSVDIAKKHCIKYGTFCLWRRTGLVCEQDINKCSKDVDSQ